MARSRFARQARALARLGATSLHVLHGTSIALLRFPSLDAGGRAARVQWWSRKLLRLMGITLLCDGTPRAGATLLVANHVSWLDILAIHSVCPQARFVSKADVHSWPVIGLLVSAAGTLFIERERKRDALRVVHRMAESLDAGETVAIFPEGTTGDGTALLPFHANLLQAAIAARVPVQPVALRYSDVDSPCSRAVSYVGDTSLLQSLWWVAQGEGVRVRVRFLGAHDVRDADRRRLAEQVSREIEQALRA